MPTETAEKRSPRERLLAAADELFYAEGIQSVGIDRVIERAGVAKASLYSTFGSKEALVRAYLDARHERTVSRLVEAVEGAPDPRAKILAVFDAQAELFRAPDFNGCAFTSATAEAAPDGSIQDAADQYRAWVRALFTDLAREAGATDDKELGRQLQLIYDGGGLAARMDADPTIAAASRAAAAALIDAAIPA